MANRWMNQFFWSLEKMKCVLYAQVAIGGTGASTLSAANSKGITSITRNSAGKYTFVLNDTWVRFLGASYTQILASGVPVAITMCVVSEAVATAATRTIVVQFQDAAGAAVDPDSGAVLKFSFVLSNSTAI